MKNLMFVMVLLGSLGALAHPNSNPAFTCLDAIEPALIKATKLSASAKEVALYNLDIYEDWALEAKRNAENGFSNLHIQQRVEKSLAKHADDEVLFIPVGKLITSCVRPHLNFSGSQQAQLIIANEFLKRAQKIRKALK